MEIIRALKMRIYPNDEQKVKIDKTLGTCRFVYNHMLARNQKAYERRKEHLSNYEMQNLLPIMKNYLPWMKEADSQALKHACRQLNTAYDRFFKKKSGFLSLAGCDVQTIGFFPIQISNMRPYPDRMENIMYLSPTASKRRYIL